MKITKRTIALLSLNILLSAVILFSPSLQRVAFAVPVSPSTTISNAEYPASLENLVVTITGLQKGDNAVVSLLPESPSESSQPFLEKEVIGDGTEKITIDMSYKLKEGYYQLQIDAPDQYYREPKAWLFMVSESRLINPQGKSVTFSLIPPSQRQYEPYRGPISGFNQDAPLAPPESTPNDGLYRAEWMLSLSAPPKQAVGSTLLDSSSYYYAHYYTYEDNLGVQATIGVVDPGVTHDYSYDEFVDDHVYATDYIGAGSHWIETGWAEVSWQNDYQYLFEYDTVNGWRLIFQVSSGTSIPVRVRQYSDTTWISEWYNGSYWVQTGYADIGISHADVTIDGGEIYTPDSPSFPAATTSYAAILIDSWDAWDTDYTTYSDNGGGYDKHCTYEYWNFYVHKH